MTAKSRLYVALDAPTLADLEPWILSLAPEVGGFKVGLEILTAEGAPRVCERLRRAGLDIFLDVKFHDIPNTVEGASRQAAGLGVKLFNVHASAGEEALRRAAMVKGQSKLLAVTVLTALDEIQCKKIYAKDSREKVLEFAKMAAQAGADGVVCSPLELGALMEEPLTRDLIKVTPGIRPAGVDAGDQKRTMTPAEAIQAGASYLVVGRPITGHKDPVSAARAIVAEIEGAL